MWARVKGRTENQLSTLPFKGVYHFRPGGLKTTKGAKNFNKVLKAVELLYPLFKLFKSPYYLPMSALAKAMIQVSLKGYPMSIIEAKDIQKIGA